MAVSGKLKGGINFVRNSQSFLFLNSTTSSFELNSNKLFQLLVISLRKETSFLSII